MKMAMRNKRVALWWERLLGRLGLLRGIYYINGQETLPAPLSREEEKEVFLRLERNDEAAREILTVHNLRLVVYIAKKFESTGINVEDLISIGTIGLIKAVNTFRPQKNIKLATYASRCIENEILMSLRYTKKFQNDVSLHEPIGTDRDGNELVMLDVINVELPDFADQLDFSIQSQKMLRAVRERLTPRERLVICLRYGLWNQDVLTQQEIAGKLGISRSYVSRIEKKALKKLNAALEE